MSLLQQLGIHPWPAQPEIKGRVIINMSRDPINHSLGQKAAELDARMLEFIDSEGWVTTREAEEFFGISLYRVKTSLYRLQKAKKVRKGAPISVTGCCTASTWELCK